MALVAERLAELGPLAFGVAFFGLASLSAPVQIPLEVAAGALFGLRRGLAVVSLAKNAGCLLAFAAARAALRARRAACTADAAASPALPACLRRWHAAFDAAPLRAACLVRLSPLPIAVKNVGLAAVPTVSGATYALSTAACTLPYTLLHVLAGSRAGSLSTALAAAERAGGGVAAAGLAAAVAAALAVSFVASPRAGKAQQTDGGVDATATSAAAPALAAAPPAPPAPAPL